MRFQLFVDNDGALCCAENTRSGIGFRLFISFNENKENIVLYKHQPCLLMVVLNGIPQSSSFFIHFERGFMPAFSKSVSVVT